MRDERQRQHQERRPAALQVRLGFADLGEFLERYGTNLSDAAIFIRSRDPRPVGARLSFEVRLRGGEVVFAGGGVVRAVQLEAKGEAVPGMGLEFDTLTDESRSLLATLAEERAQGKRPAPMALVRPESWRPLSEVAAPPEESFEVVEEAAPPPVLVPVAAEAKEPNEPAEAPGELPHILLSPAPMPVEPEAAERTEPMFGTRTARTPAAWDEMPELTPGPRTVTRPRPAGPPVALVLDWSHLRLAAWDGARAVAVKLPSAAVPTAVSFAGGEWLAGAEAAAAMARGAPGVRGAWTLLGAEGARRTFERRELWATEGQGLEAAVRIGPQRATARELSVRLFSSVKRALDEAHGPVGRTVVAVPSAVSAATRRALREVAEDAGWTVERIVSLPAAWAPARARRALVLDVAEGSVEAAVVESGLVVATATDAELGTCEMDLALVGALLEQFERETGLLVPEDPAVFERVRTAAAAAREGLSDALEVEVHVPDLVAAGLARAELRQRLTRARLLALVGPLLDRAFEVAKQALAQRGLGPKELDAVILAGAGSRLAYVARRFSERFGRDVTTAPEDGAASGAAAFFERSRASGAAAGSALWAGLPGAGLRRLFDRGTRLPAEQVYAALQTNTNQRELELHLFQGDRQPPTTNDYLGTAIAGPLPTGRGLVQVQFTVGLDENGELVLRAKETATGRAIPVRLDVSRGADVARRAVERRT